MIGVYDGRTIDVLATCEVVKGWGRDGTEWAWCGKPTTHFYPALGGGTMALCAECAKPHGRHAWPVV